MVVFPRPKEKAVRNAIAKVVVFIPPPVEPGEAPVVNSRYSIVMATSKRARQLIAGELPLVPAKDGQKPLSIAIEELNEGELKILPEDTDEE